MIELPIRTFMGAARTTCDCLNCSISCRYVPGFLMIEDIYTLAGSRDLLEAVKWAESNCLASPGAVVMITTKLGVREIIKIPTIVPRRKPDSTECHWLDPNGQMCAIHDNAPFGCAFFDSHGDPDKQQELSRQALSVLLEDKYRNGNYSLIWHHLTSLGKIAPSAEQSRQRMTAAIGHRRTHP